MTKKKKGPLQVTAIGNDPSFRRVVFYVRYSSDNQRHESIEQQLEVLEAYAKANNMIVVGIYADEAKTATNDDRENFQRMLSDSVNGDFDTVLVYKFDRFARNKFDSVVNKRKLRDNGVTVISALENVGDGPEAVLIESLHEGYAEYYSRNLSRHSTAALRKNAAVGKSTGGIPAYGYDVDKVTKQFVINEKEAYVVNQIFEKYASGMSYAEILKWVQENGFTTKKNEPFKKNSLHFILKNEKYVGTYKYKTFSQSKYEQNLSETIRVDDGVPAIVKQETFDIVQKMLEQNKHNSQMTKAKEIYILSGRAFCGICGSRMIGNRRKSKNGTYWSGYQCSGRKKHICVAKEINKQKLEEVVIDHLENKVFTDEFINKTAQEVVAYYTNTTEDRSTELNSAKARYREITTQIDNILTAVMNGFASELLNVKLQELEYAKADCSANIAILSAKADSQFTIMDIKKYLALGQGISFLEPHEQQRVLSKFVERVIVHEDHVDIQLAIKTSNDGRGLVGDPYAYRFLTTFLHFLIRDPLKMDSHGRYRDSKERYISVKPKMKV